MAAGLRVLIDLNVILDLLQRREPFYTMSSRVLACAETGAIQGYVAAHTLTTLFYLVAKDRTPEQARLTLTDLLRFLTVAPVDGETIAQALSLPYRDFEDAVQMVSAAQIGAHYLVTRNTQDYKLGPVSVLHPAELLALL
jgi:predicted nucleic acid-binding protein